MPEKFQTEAYEDRASSKVGVADYLKSTVAWAVLPPVIGYLAGLGARKVANIDMLNKPVMGNVRMAELAGAKLGAAVGLFHLWKENTSRQLQVTDVVEQAQKLKDMESPNAHLEQENEQLRQQLKFTEMHAPRAHGQSHAEHVRAEQAAAPSGTMQI